MKETYFIYAKAYAFAGNVDKTVEYLDKAREAGFVDWPRILREKEFEKVRDDTRVKNFLKSPASRGEKEVKGLFLLGCRTVDDPAAGFE